MTSELCARARLFEGGGLAAVELRRDDMPLLQAFFEEHPDYFTRVNGLPPRPDEALLEYDDLPPPEMEFSRRWVLALLDGQQQLQGAAIVLSDLLHAGVWHLALFIIATPMHGQGVAGPAYRALEAWAATQGAAWMRLGVVLGNGRAEAFWQRMGFELTRTRPYEPTPGRVHTVRAMVKPLTAGVMADYLARVPRDRPESI